jgi:hypothetical protein
MAEKFMYVCLGILALTVTFHLGARYGEASYLDHSMTGIVAANGNFILLDNGEVWDRTPSQPEWMPHPHLTPPMPLAEIKFWGSSAIVTQADDLWMFYDGQWVNFGSPPGYVTTQSTTWGRIKAEFRE